MPPKRRRTRSKKEEAPEVVEAVTDTELEEFIEEAVTEWCEEEYEESPVPLEPAPSTDPDPIPVAKTPPTNPPNKRHCQECGYQTWAAPCERCGGGPVR